MRHLNFDFCLFFVIFFHGIPFNSCTYDALNTHRQLPSSPTTTTLSCPPSSVTLGPAKASKAIPLSAEMNAGLRSSIGAARSLRAVLSHGRSSALLAPHASRIVAVHNWHRFPSKVIMYMSSAATALTLTTTATNGKVSLMSRAFSDHSALNAAATVSNTIKQPDILLYQYEVCPFCNKVRAYLDYHNIPYRVVEVDPLRKTELKHLSADYRKVPIAFVNGEQVNGSGNVIDTVNALMHGDKAQLNTEEQRWLKWLDDHFIHLIAPNIYRTAGESLQTFNYIADNAKFSAFQRSTIRYTGALAMYFVGRKKKKQYNIEDERLAMHEALREWTNAIRDGGGKFLGGSNSPSVADLSIYGVLKAIATFDAFAEIIEKNPELHEWYGRTQAAVGDTSLTARE